MLVLVLLEKPFSEYGIVVVTIPLLVITVVALSFRVQLALNGFIVVFTDVEVGEVGDLVVVDFMIFWVIGFIVSFFSVS